MEGLPVSGSGVVVKRKLENKNFFSTNWQMSFPRNWLSPGYFNEARRSRPDHPRSNKPELNSNKLKKIMFLPV